MRDIPIYTEFKKPNYPEMLEQNIQNTKILAKALLDVDDPKELCKLCLKFYNDGHYDNDPDMQPLYEMLKKLHSLLNKDNKQ